MEDFMKKFLILILTLTCFVCLGLAAACSHEPKYYILTLENVRGVTYDCEVPSGFEVKDGEEVAFKISCSDKVQGEPVVKANDDVLTADESGFYKFIMKSETTVTVTGISYLNSYNVTFDRGDNRIAYKDADGKELTSVVADEGDEISFSLDISVYYNPESKYSVLANTVILSENDGLYKFNVTADTNITVIGLVEDTGFTERRGAGSGTADDPYLIEKPVDLYYMSALVRDPFYNGRFGASHYKLMNDIDLQGEQLFIIGDGIMSSGQSTLTSYFAGTFDGNGKTISNYYISDTFTDESTSYLPVFMPYIGMFGIANANTNAPVEIRNLHLKDFTIDIDGAKLGGSSFYAGGLVGYGIGVNITGCTVEGVINANGPAESNFGYVGGVVGRLLSAYGSETLKFNSTLVSTQADVEVNGNAGWIYAAGGLVGSLEASDEAANSYIFNSYSKANVAGAVNTGGLVGYMGAYTAIKNSYFVGGLVEAYSAVPNNATLSRYAHSYAGGIAGYVSYDAIIYSCYTSADVSAYAVTPGNAFNHAGAVAGARDGAGLSFVEASEALVINTYTAAAGHTLNRTFATDTLNWIAGDWNFDGQYPVPVSCNAAYILTFDYGNVAVIGSTTKEVGLSGAYTMAELYEDADSGVQRFVGSGVQRSYGYFFDSGLTQKVPLAYVPYGNETFYTGFADYSQVAGKYYIVGGNGAYLELCLNGTLIYREGAFSHTTFYSYNGSSVTMYENAAFEVIESILQSDGKYLYNSIYFCAEANVGSDGTLSIVNIASGYNGSAVVDRSNYYTSASPLVVVKELENFVYGNYSASNVTYTFSPDGTGTAGAQEFTYKVDGNVITLTTDGGVQTGTINSDGVVTAIGNTVLSPYDAFFGAWEKSATSVKSFNFDGLGNYIYNYYEKVGRDIVLRTENGTYSVEGNVLTTDKGVKVSFDDDGFLEADFGSYKETFYKYSSFAGEWKYFNTTEAVGITFNGINNENYGTGRIVYGANRYISDFDYSVVAQYDEENETTIVTAVLYQQDALLGELTYNASDDTLRGSIYSYYYNRLTSGALFCIYDDFRGEWISEEFGVIQFNGLGRYDFGGSGSGIVRTRGLITINGEAAGNYKVDAHILSGSFSYNGKIYNIVYNEETKAVNVKESEREFDLICLDDLHGVTYVSSSGDKYSFNGGGYLPNGGTVTLNGVQTYSYKITSEVTEILSAEGQKIGEFVKSPSSNVFVLTVNSVNTNLTVENPFTGEWVVGGAVDGKLVISEVGADFTAIGSYLGEAVTFVYDVEGNRLSFTLANGTKLYVNSFSYNGQTELTVGDNEYGYGSYNICLPEDRVGALKGVYTSSFNSSVYLDGMNVGVFANGRGTAVVVNGNSSLDYVYRVNGGQLVLTRNTLDGNTETLIMREVPLTHQGAYVNGEVAYELLATDYFYNVRVRDISENPTYYTFDGIGGVTDSKGKTYTYEIIDFSLIDRVYTLKLTDTDGVVYTAIYDYFDSPTISVVQENGTVTE